MTPTSTALALAELPISAAAIGGLIWGCLTIVYTIFSLVLVYHWREYATNATVARRTLVWYFATTGTCLLAAGVLLLFL